MTNNLVYITTDEYKIKNVRRQLLIKSNNLMKMSNAIFTDDVRELKLRRVFNNMDKLYNKLSKDISLREVIIDLILLEREIIKEVYKDGVDVELENLLFFIMDSKLKLLIDDKSIADEIVKIAKSAKSSENKKLNKVGNLIMKKLTDEIHNASLEDRLIDIVESIDEYNKALGTIASLSEELNETVNVKFDDDVEILNNELKNIMSTNYELMFI